MKTIISLAVATLLMFGSCKKGEIEDIKPQNPTTAEKKPEAKLAPTTKENAAAGLNNGDPVPY